MQNNITEVVEYIKNILSEFSLDFDISEDQEDTHVYEIYSDFNIDAVIKVVADEDTTIHYYIRYNGETKYSSKWSLNNDFTAEENEAGIKEIILEFNANLALLNTVIEDIMLKINDIKNICNENELNYENFIEDKVS